MDEIVERLDRVKQTYRENIFDDKKPDGLLTNKEEEYFKCLELNRVQLDDYMKEDLAHWTANLEIVKKQAQEVQN